MPVPLSYPYPRTGGLRAAPEPQTPAPISDGYGVLFDPVKHVQYLRDARIADYTDPCNTGYIDPDAPPKERPAGYYDRGSGT